jgi:hypothetical protein
VPGRRPPVRLAGSRPGAGHMNDFDHFYGWTPYNYGAAAGAFLARNRHAPAQGKEPGNHNCNHQCPFHGRFSQLTHSFGFLLYPHKASAGRRVTTVRERAAPRLLGCARGNPFDRVPIRREYAGTDWRLNNVGDSQPGIEGLPGIPPRRDVGASRWAVRPSFTGGMRWSIRWARPGA